MLYLYQNITPNYNATHYYFTDFSKYLTFLNDYKLKEINAKSYIINLGMIRCKIDETLTLSNYKNVTYIIDTNDNMCYLVNSALVQSGYVEFNVSLDNWGSYIYKANFDNIYINRCNRHISDYGIYDNIQNTTHEINKISINDKDGATNENCCFIITLEGKNFANDSLTLTYILGVKVTEAISLAVLLYELQNTTYLSYIIGDSSSTIIRFLKEVSIKKVIPIREDDFDNNFSYHAVPSNPESSYFVLCKDETTKWDNLKTYYANIQGFSIQSGYIEDNISHYITHTYFYDTNLNYKVFFGGLGNALEEIKYTSQYQYLTITYLLSLNDVKITIQHGKNILNLENLLNLPVVARDNVEATSNLGNILRIIFGAIHGGIGILSGNPFMSTRGISGIGGGIAGLIEQREQQQNQAKAPLNLSHLSDGTFFNYSKLNNARTSNNSLKFYYYYLTSTIDEKVRARKTGATFNEYVNNLDFIFSQSFLGTGKDTDDTLIQCNLHITNIPLEAINNMTSKFSNGVYVKQIN